MSKWIKIFFCAAMIFSFSSANVSAAVVEMSNDNIETFMSKCNSELKKNNPDDGLDIPKLSETFKTYTDSVQVTDDTQVKIIYTTKDDKIYSIKLESEKYDATVKSCFDVMENIFLKALGLNDEAVKELTDTEGNAEWRKEKFVTELNKRFIVSLKNSKLIIVAADK